MKKQTLIGLLAAVVIALVGQHYGQPYDWVIFGFAMMSWPLISGLINALSINVSAQYQIRCFKSSGIALVLAWSILAVEAYSNRQLIMPYCFLAAIFQGVMLFANMYNFSYLGEGKRFQNKSYIKFFNERYGFHIQY